MKPRNRFKFNVKAIVGAAFRRPQIGNLFAGRASPSPTNFRLPIAFSPAKTLERQKAMDVNVKAIVGTVAHDRPRGWSFASRTARPSIQGVINAAPYGFSFTGLLLCVLKAYKTYISPILPPACRFYPTCSVYAYEAVMKYGAVKGSVLAVKRIARCNPFCESGYDPVP